MRYSLFLITISGSPDSSQISEWLQLVLPWLLISARSSHFRLPSVYNPLLYCGEVTAIIILKMATTFLSLGNLRPCLCLLSCLRFLSQLSVHWSLSSLLCLGCLSVKIPAFMLYQRKHYRVQTLCAVVQLLIATFHINCWLQEWRGLTHKTKKQS